jgi:hypothetical protein
MQSTLLTISAIVVSYSNLEGQFLRKTTSNAEKSIPEGLVVPAAPIFSFRRVENKGIEVK